MKLIDKDRAIAEIEKEIKQIYAGREYVGIPSNEENMVRGLQKSEDIINSLEVKEVDLEKEIDKFYGIYRKDGKTYSIEDNEKCFDWKEDCNPDFEIAFAKHFFELGMAAFDTVKHS